MRPDLSRVAEWYHGYIQTVPEDNLMEAFEHQTALFIHFLENMPAHKYDYRYAPEKWTIREVLQHIIDAERVFSYRALRFARFDPTPLPGFDENLFAANARAADRSWHSLVEEFKAVRQSSFLLFQSLDVEQLQAGGTSSGNPCYVLAFGYIIIGHALHHQIITEERYLK